MSDRRLSFELPGAGHVLFTDRTHGNLSSVTGDGAERAYCARERLRERIGVRRLVRGRQVHGAVVEIVTDAGSEGTRGATIVAGAPGASRAPARAAGGPGADPPPIVDADGQVSGLPEVGVMVLTADCLPVALGRRRERSASGAARGDRGAVAMLHAGWRGLAAGVLEEGVRAIRAPGGAGELVAIVGPGAGACCYEVGEEVHATFTGAHRRGRHINLSAIARDRLLAAGVAEVQVLDTCTVCDERFFSHRREGARAGRQGGLAWLA